MSKENLKIGPREKLIQTANQLFYEQGYRNTGISQIISEADCARASFYHYFKSKDELCIAYLRTLNEAVIESICGDPLKDPYARIIKLVNDAREFIADAGFRGCPFINLIAEAPDIDQEIRDIAVGNRKDIASYLEAAIDELGTAGSGESSRELAEQVLLAILGAEVQSQIYLSDWPFDAAEKLIRKLLDSCR